MSAGTEEKMPMQDLVLSLTGFDEIAIEKAFKSDLEDLSAQKQMRAIAFILYRREGQTDSDAYASAMGATQKDVLDMFGVDIEDVMADAPDSEVGKDD